MWYSSRGDVDRCWTQPSSDTSVSRRGIRPAGDTSTYRHKGVGYGHSSNYDNVHRVQHHSITPGQRRHINTKDWNTFHASRKQFLDSLVQIFRGHPVTKLSFDSISRLRNSLQFVWSWNDSLWFDSCHVLNKHERFLSREGMIIEWPLNGQFPDVVIVIIMSQMAVSKNFLTVAFI